MKSKMARVISVLVIFAVLAISALSTIAATAPAGTEQDMADPANDMNKEVAAARAATAKYHDVATAEADGYMAVTGCVESPDGAMGFHYVKPGLLGDGNVVNAEEPEALLYLPNKHGKLRLVGVEYVTVVEDPDDVPPPPTVLGQELELSPPHGDEVPFWHYEIHAWWAHNPDGMFVPWNPALSC